MIHQLSDIDNPFHGAFEYTVQQFIRLIHQVQIPCEIIRRTGRNQGEARTAEIRDSVNGVVERAVTSDHDDILGSFAVLQDFLHDHIHLLIRRRVVHGIRMMAGIETGSYRTFKKRICLSGCAVGIY